jgi:predicted ATPase/class 3 adenylate cyclase
MPRDLPSGTVTFLFTDVEGSTRLLHELGANAYAAALAEHRRVIREACAAEDGVEVDTQGDAFFFAFPTAPGAIASASEFTEALAAAEIRVRVGLHTGEPLVTEEGYVGDDVHFAARVAATSHGGQVVLSAATAELVEAPLTDLGSHRLKDIPEPVSIFQLGDGAFPPLKTIANTNLPSPVSSFLGREHELFAADELLQRTRLLTVSGPGGQGKTRFALELARRAREERFSDYPAGVFGCFLASLRDPALVLPSIAQTLSVKERPGVSVLDALAAQLEGTRTLVLIDNLEHLLDAASELSQLLRRADGLTLLVTSRELLRIEGETAYALPPLPEGEGVALLCERARLEPSPDIAELCRRLEGLPLAIELAAARTAILTPAQLLDRLAQRLDLLKAGRGADPRQQTLRATIEWSYDLLTPGEQRLFRSLSVFQGGCTLEPAEEVAGADLDSLQSLVDKSLLRFTEERFWMLATIREYAAEKLLEAGDEDSLRDRHLAWLARETHARAGPSRNHDPEARSFLEGEQPNIRDALTWALRRGNAEFAQMILNGTWFHWLARGSGREGDEWATRVVAMPSESTEVYGWALGVAGEFPRFRGDSERARLLKLRAISVLEQLDGDDRTASHLAALHSDLSDVLARLGDLDGARDHAERALGIRRGLGSSPGIAHALDGLATVAERQQRPAQAAELYQEAAATAEALGDMPGAAESLAGLARVRLVSGDVRGARAAAITALERSTEVDDRYIRATALAICGLVAHAEGEAREAALLLAQARAEAEEFGFQLDPLIGVEAVLETCRAVLGEKQFDEAFAAGLDLARAERS